MSTTSALQPRVLHVGGAAIRVERRSLVVTGAATLLLLIVAAVTLTTGDYPIPLSRVLRTLVGAGNPTDTFIVETLRLPRLLTAVLVGAALGVGGSIFQSVARNPLASPDIVGFNAGAATGALLVIVVIHGSTAQTAVGSLLGGVGTALLVYLLAMKRGVQGYRLILVGIGLAAMLQSTNSYLLTRANIVDAQAAAVWMTGNLNGRGWEHVRPVAACLVVLLPLAIWLGRQLRMLELGDELGTALGLRPERIRLAALLVGVGLAAVGTACAGPIVFVALTAPQVARRLTRVPGPNVVPSAVLGALLLTTSDFIAQRLFAPTQLPVGVVTGVLGGGYLAWLLSREVRGRTP